MIRARARRSPALSSRGSLLDQPHAQTRCCACSTSLATTWSSSSQSWLAPDILTAPRTGPAPATRCKAVRSPRCAPDTSTRLCCSSCVSFRSAEAAIACKQGWLQHRRRAKAQAKLARCCDDNSVLCLRDCDAIAERRGAFSNRSVATDQAVLARCCTLQGLRRQAILSTIKNEARFRSDAAEIAARQGGSKCARTAIDHAMLASPYALLSVSLRRAEEAIASRHGWSVQQSAAIDQAGRPRRSAQTSDILLRADDDRASRHGGSQHSRAAIDQAVLEICCKWNSADWRRRGGMD